MQTLLYDKNGNQIKGTPQTSIGSVPGVFYITFKILGSNTGNVQLYNLNLIETNDGNLTMAVKGKELNPLQPTLGVGQTNILLWDTASSCISEANCAPNEKCVGSPLSCKIDISNFLGTKTFNATVEGSYKDAYGVQQAPVETIVLSQLEFIPDRVIFRTDSLEGEYGLSGTQIAVDRDGDQNLESYVKDLFGTTDYSPTDFLAFTPQRNIVWRCAPSNAICLIASTTLNKDISNSGVTRWTYIQGGNLPITNSPLEPYLSQNCNGLKPCQETYTVGVIPAPQTCGNNLKEGTEICDGTDLAGNDCTTIGQGFTGGNLQCSGSCGSWITSSCTSAEAGLLAYYKFNNNVFDETGKHSGVITGNPQYTSAIDGTGLTFDGNDYVTVQDAPELNITTFTISFWFKNTYSASSVQSPISRGESTPADIAQWLVEINDDVNRGKIQLWYEETNDADHYFPSTTSIQQNRWYHFAVTRNASDGNVKVYLNGNLELDRSDIQSPGIVPSPILIGVRANTLNTLQDYFTGTLDEIRIYNKPLTSGEILAIYNQFTSPVQPNIISSKVSANNDDAEEDLDSKTMHLSSTDLELGYDTAYGSHTQIVGTRFTNVQIPKGATIKNAYVEFECDEAPYTGNVILEIRGEATDNSKTFSTILGNISLRPNTNSAVSWTITEQWAVDVKYRSPDISSIIQEIINRPNWNSGNSISIKFIGTGTTRRIAEAFEGESANAPTLYVEY